MTGAPEEPIVTPAAALATTGDVSNLWRPLSGAESTRAKFLCTVASAAFRARIPGLDDAINDGTFDGDLVRGAVAGVVARAMANPNNAVSVSDTTGPYSHTESYASTAAQSASSLGLAITEADLELVTGRPAFDMPRTIRARSSW